MKIDFPILKLPESGSLVRIRTRVSGHAPFGLMWSDGSFVTVRGVFYEWLQKNPDTEELFWRDECTEVKEPSQMEMKQLEIKMNSEEEDGALKVTLEKLEKEKVKYASVPSAESPNEDDLYASLKSLADQVKECPPPPSVDSEVDELAKELDEQFGKLENLADRYVSKQKYIRTQIWWKSNIGIRNGFVDSLVKELNNIAKKYPEKREELQRRIASFDKSEMPEYVENLRQLRSLLDLDDTEERIRAAEASRQLGDHDSSSDLLDYDYPDSLQNRVNVIAEANKIGERRLLSVLWP